MDGENSLMVEEFIEKSCLECKQFLLDKIGIFKRPKNFCSRKCYMKYYMRDYFKFNRSQHKKHLFFLKTFRFKNPHYFQNYNFLKRFGSLLPKPPRCVCGKNEYMFLRDPRKLSSRRLRETGLFREYTPRAVCRNCGGVRVFIPEKNEWSLVFLLKN